MLRLSTACLSALCFVLQVTNSPARAADVDSGQDIQVIDLAPNASGDSLTGARQKFQQGQIVRVVGGTRKDVERLLQLTLSESSAKTKNLASSFGRLLLYSGDSVFGPDSVRRDPRV